MKKTIITILAFFIFIPTTFASFSDVPQSHHYYTAITWLEDEGVVEGYSDGTFKPEQLVNRAEFLKMLYETTGMAGFSIDLPFPDVPYGEWYTKYVEEAYATKVINGYPDGTFKPEQTINFAEALKIVTNGFYNVNELYGDGNDYEFCLADFSWMAGTGEWYWKYVYVADSYCLIPEYLMGITAWQPDQYVTRGDMAELLYRAQTVKNNGMTRFSGGETPDDNSGEVRFDSCGTYFDYANHDWHTRLEVELFALEVNLDDLTDVCHSQNGDMVVLIHEGGYCESGAIYRFDTDNLVLESAKFDIKGQNCVSGVDTVGKRQGDIIPIYGTDGDAGCVVKMYYDYNFILNTVELIKSLASCEGQEEQDFIYY